MQEAILDAIPDEGVSYSRLYNFFPNWQDSTFKAILDSLIEAGVVSKTAGGGSGLIRRVDEDTRELESEQSFLAALEKQTKAKDSDPRGIRSEELREILQWNEEKFYDLRKTLKDRGDLVVRSGPGSFLSLPPQKASRTSPSPAVSRVTATKVSPKELAPASDTPPSSATATESPAKVKITATAATKANLIDASRDRDEALSALEELLQKGEKVTNQRLREFLKWSETRYWQARTLLHDAGNVTFEPGSGGILHIQKRASLLPIRTLNLDLQRKLLLALPNDGRPEKMTILAERFGEAREKLTEAGTRLQGAGLARFSSDAEELGLSPQVIATQSNDTDEADILDRLVDFGSPIAEHVLQRSLGWAEHRFFQAMSRLVKRTPAVLTRDERVGIINLLSSPGVAVREAHERQLPSPCRSPLQFDQLVDSLRTGKVIAFVGAGSSADTGVPGWGQLIDQLLASTKSIQERARAEIVRYLDQRRFIDALSALQSNLGEHHFSDSVRAALGPANQSKPCTPLVTALTLLADRLESVITTNLDSILEAAFSWRVELDLSPNTEIAKRVVKAHGTLDKPETWVLTRRQYSKKYLGNAAYRDRFLAMYNHSTLMFLGYGMQDVELDSILEWIEGNYHTHQQPRHFFLVHEDDEANSPFFYRRLQELGLRPVLYRSPPQEGEAFKTLNRHAYLPILLAQLAIRAQKKLSG